MNGAIKEKVSVIIPCYNIAAYIDRCFESIVKQTYGIENTEIIMVDDNSSDGTTEKLEALERAYPDNVILIKNSTNAGPGTSRNTALEYASGKYVSFVDGDDVILPDMLSEMVGLSAKYDCDVVECDHGVFDKTAGICPETSGTERFLEIAGVAQRKQFILDSMKTAVWGRLYRKSFIDDKRIFFPDFVYNYEDVFFSGLAMYSIERYCRTDRKLYWYYRNPAGLDHSVYKRERMRAEIAVLKQLLDEIQSRNAGQALNGLLRETEFFCLWKGLLDPLRKIVVSFSDEDEMLAEGLFFADNILNLLPGAYDNVYLRSLNDDLAGMAFKLLNFAASRKGKH